jgi:hypothetical protein
MLKSLIAWFRVPRGTKLITKGYGLDEKQQRYISDLYQWQEESKKSKVILGGAIED